MSSRIPKWCIVVMTSTFAAACTNEGNSQASRKLDKQDSPHPAAPLSAAAKRETFFSPTDSPEHARQLGRCVGGVLWVNTKKPHNVSLTEYSKRTYTVLVEPTIALKKKKLDDCIGSDDSDAVFEACLTKIPQADRDLIIGFIQGFQDFEKMPNHVLQEATLNATCLSAYEEILKK